MFKKIIFLVSLYFVSNVLIAKPLDLIYFAKQPKYTDVKLSPDGKHFAAQAPLEGRDVVVIINRKSMKPIFVFQFKEKENVDEFYWVNEQRIVFTRSIQRQSQEQNVTYGQIYAGNIDGSKRQIIFGHNATTRHKSARTGAESSFGDIVHLLPDDPKHILITSRDLRNNFDTPEKIVKLNVYTTRRTTVSATPLGNIDRLLFTSDGALAFATGTDRQGIKRNYRYTKNSWKEIKKNQDLADFTPILVSEDGEKVYLVTHPNKGTLSLFEQDLSTNEIHKIYQHPTSDIRRYIANPKNKQIVGVEVMPGAVEYHYFDKNNRFAKLHSKLAKAFDKKGIRITSATSDYEELVVLVKSDKNPGDFYLFNTKTNSASYLMSKKNWIDPSIMAERKPIQFKARDGQTIYGYLTRPNDSKISPLVTYVHGGPYGVRDYWWYDSTAQMLANNGYAVLQVNYRGSGGHGFHYEHVAYKKRSTLIQQDIIDGTKWALSQPFIKDDQACIMGWSFGGYSALMAPLIEPDLFKCSIAAAGVYDAIEQEDDADYSKVKSVAAEAAIVYGKDEDLLKKESPLTYIDKLKIPVFIVHGGKDRRVRPAQAYLLRDALEERNMPYEWLFKPKEGHGFYKESNQEEFYKRSLEFLAKHLENN